MPIHRRGVPGAKRIEAGTFFCEEGIAEGEIAFPSPMFLNPVVQMTAFNEDNQWPVDVQVVSVWSDYPGCPGYQSGCSFLLAKSTDVKFAVTIKGLRISWIVTEKSLN